MHAYRPADVELRSGRLVLRPMEPTDGGELSRAGGEGDDPYPFMSVHPGDPRYLHEALAERQAGVSLPFVVAVDDIIVGSTRYADIRPAHQALEIGWTWYVPRLRRTWLNGAVKQLLLAYAFDELGMVRVQLKCDARNAASRAAILALGAVQEGILRKHYRYPDGFVRDTVMFSILRDEWPAVAAKLRERIRRLSKPAAPSA